MNTKPYLTYKKSLVLSILCNIVVLLLVSFLVWYGTEEPIRQATTAPVVLDMKSYKIQPVGNAGAQGAKESGGESTGGTQAGVSNANEEASADFDRWLDTPGNAGAETNNQGEESTGSPSGQVAGNSGSGSGGTLEGVGSGNGGSGSGTVGGGDGAKNPGYVDVTGFVARVNQNAKNQYPMQALRMRRSGVVVFSVTFDSQGAVTAVTMVQSSGTRSLDQKAQSLIWNGGRITNTTGKSTVERIAVNFVLTS